MITTISINGMDITGVFVTKFIGVHLDFPLNWSKHLSVIGLTQNRKERFCDAGPIE